MHDDGDEDVDNCNNYETMTMMIMMPMVAAMMMLMTAHDFDNDADNVYEQAHGSHYDNDESSHKDGHKAINNHKSEDDVDDSSNQC